VRLTGNPVEGVRSMGTRVVYPFPHPPTHYAKTRPLTPAGKNGLPIPLYRVMRTEDDLHNYLLRHAR